MDKPKTVRKELAVDCGQPQKLPYLYIEKIVEKREDTSKTPINICILLKFISNFPDIKTFNIHAKSDIRIKTIINVCLLKSKTSEVQGKKKIGIKNINA